MAKIILISPSAVWDASAGKPYDGIVKALSDAKNSGHVCCMVSNNSAPAWAKEIGIPFRQEPGRQSGKFIPGFVASLSKYQVRQSDLAIIGSKDEDLLMAVNSKTLLLRADWVNDLGTKIAKYGIPMKRASAIPLFAKLLGDEKPWYFTSATSATKIYVLTNAGDSYQPDNGTDMTPLISALRKAYKDGVKTYRKGFLLHLMSSLFSSDEFRDVDLWGYYPSSSSKNDDSDSVAGASHLVREAFKCRSAKKGEPLFIRHVASPKRSAGQGGNRSDPTSQITSIHLNPIYREKLPGAKVVVFDDFTTYGLSFGVATAFLREAGADAVYCVAIGQFGRCLREYQIGIAGRDVFKPIKTFGKHSSTTLTGSHVTHAQLDFFDKFETVVK